MSNESHRRTLQPSRPVDPSVLHVLRLLDPIAREAGCEYFVAGATARDLILVNLHGLRPGRATRDIDFGIAVESWDVFELLKNRLITTGEFKPTSELQQHLTCTSLDGSVCVPIDLIPFRGVVSADLMVAWPPGRDLVLNVAGFEEALASAVLIEIDEGVVIRVASASGLALLKLIAWKDRGRANNKDATDLHRLFASYADAGNTDRLYDHESDLLESAGFDIEVAGAELLGRDVGRICSRPAMQEIRGLLESEPDLERLVNQMAQGSIFPERLSAIDRIVNAFRRGFLKQVEG